MTGRREAKRDALRAGLIEAAGSLIAEGGLKALRARDIATRAGCALGSLYTVFEDIDALILEVNQRTLRAIETDLDRALAEAGEEEPFEALGLAYLHFAAENRNLWAALFEHRMPENASAPDWMREEHIALIARIAKPLARLMPTANPEAIAGRARTFFGAVHGVILISLENRFVGVSLETLEREIVTLTKILAHGQMQLG